MDFEELIEEPSDRIMVGFNLTQSIKELDSAGFWLFAGKENRKITGGIGNPMLFPVLLLRVKRKESREIIKIDFEKE